MKIVRFLALSFVLVSVALTNGCSKPTTPTVIEGDGPVEDTYVEPEATTEGE